MQLGKAGILLGDFGKSRKAKADFIQKAHSLPKDKVVERTATYAKQAGIPRTKVLVLTDAFLPHAGGSREYYHNIYQGMAGLGDSQVTILTKRIPGWEEFDRQANTPFYEIRRKFKPLTSTKYGELPKGIPVFLQALWSVLRDRPSVIHAGDLYPQGVIAMMFKKLFSIPYVIYCHGEEIPQLNRSRFQPRVRNRIYMSADAVIANSEFTRQSLLRLGVPKERICKITPGVHVERFQPAACDADLRNSYGLKEKLILLTVARLVPRKGHRLVMQALSKLKAKFPNAHYLIVGKGPEEPELRKLASEFGISDRVIFAGYVPAEKLPEFYRLCDIVVMPNRVDETGDLEGFGMVFLEANAAGKPAVAGRTGGAAEAVADGSTGYLVDPEDADELASVLDRLLADKNLRDRLGSAGLERVRHCFSWHERAVVLRDLNRKIIGLTESK